MAAQPLLLSVEEFHKLYDGARPAYEYWYGVAIRKSMPTALHGAVQFIIMMLLERARWNAISEVRLKVARDAEPIPDIIAVRGKFKGRYPTVAPDLCVEIMSPGDTLPKAFDKAAKYILWGTQTVWVIDPEKRTAWSVSLSTTKPLWVPPDGSLMIGETSISLPALFSEVDKRLDLTGDLE